MSSSGLLAFHVATDAVVSTSKWYTFMCASDEALAAYRWRMKFNGLHWSPTITLRVSSDVQVWSVTGVNGLF